MSSSPLLPVSTHLVPKKDYEVALYDFKSSLEHYLKTGIGSPQELLSFINTYQTDIKKEKDISQWLNSIFPPLNDKVPLTYQHIDTTILKTSLDIVSDLLKIWPKQKDRIFQFLIHENFDYYDRSFEHSSIFRSTHALTGLHNAYVGLQSIIDFKRQEKIIMCDHSAARFMDCVRLFLRKNEYLVSEEEKDIKLQDKQAAKQIMGDILYLYAFHILVREPGAIEEFESKINQEFPWGHGYALELSTAIDKAKLNYFSPPKPQHTKINKEKSPNKLKI